MDEAAGRGPERPVARQDETPFRTLIEHSSDAISLIDAGGVILYASPSTRRVLGYAAEEMIGRQAGDLIHPEDRTAAEQGLAEVLRHTGATASTRCRVRHRDGTWRWMEGVATNLLADPAIRAVVINYRDISERQRAEDDLRRVIASARCLLWHAEVTEDDRRQIVWDTEFFDEESFQSKFPIAIAPGQTLAEAWHRSRLPEDRERLDREAIEAVRSGERFFSQEFRHRMSDGALVWFLQTITAEPREPGRWSLTGVCVDITERKQAEQEVANRNARLQLLSETANRLLLDDDPQRLIQGLFRRLSALLGLEVYLNYMVTDDGRGLRLASYGGIAPDAARAAEHLDLGEAVCGQVAQTRAPIVAENVQESPDPLAALVRASGVTAYVCHPLIANDRLIGTLSFGTRTRSRFTPDELSLLETVCNQVAVAIDRSRLIAELQERARALAAADARKNEFLAMLAHELRNPLAPVLSAAHLLRLVEGADPRMQRAVAVIERQVRQMARLIDDLLDVSRITRNKIDLKKGRADLATVLRHAVQTSRPLIDERAHRLIVTEPAAPIVLEADAARLEQVFTNLLNNAAKFTDPGGEIRVSAGTEGPEAVVRVEDTGRGIPPDVLPHVFDLFTQADAAVDRSQGGLGLGLTLVDRLVRMHGGSVNAASAGPGMGSEFTVRLPILAETEAPP